jgi:hypothetical protein
MPAPTRGPGIEGTDDCLSVGHDRGTPPTPTWNCSISGLVRELQVALADADVG